MDVSEVLASMGTRSSKDAGDDDEEADKAGPQDWVKAQKSDQDLEMLKRWLKDGKRPSRQDILALSPALRNHWASFDQFMCEDVLI